MSFLRRAIGRKESLIAALLFLVVGGGLGGWWLLQSARGQLAPSDDVLRLKALLDAGDYQQVILEADAVTTRSGPLPTILSYKTLAQHLLNDPQTEATADAILAIAPTGQDAAEALAVKALEALRYERQDATAARQAATAAMQEAGDDATAGFLSRLAYAAAIRQVADPADITSLGTSDPALLATEIRQTLEPVFALQPAEPQAVWQRKLWRHSLALLVDAGILASQADDGSGEAASLAVLRQACPEDVWTCYFRIPDRALAAARQGSSLTGSLDDHARVAMYTATGFLYTQAGDRMHCDVLFRRALQAYGRLLEAYDGWEGEQTETITPAGVRKTVGKEFYAYRNRAESLAKYSADWWGIRAVAGQAPLADALAASDHKLFRAIVRVRADRQTDPIVILHQERLAEPLFSTVADWFLKRPYPPQADWEQQRAELIEQIGAEEVQAVTKIADARRLVAQARHEEALALLEQGLQTEPTLAETGVSYRCEAASVLMSQNRHEDALAMLEEADHVLQAGDERLTRQTIAGLRGRIGYYRLLCARSTASQEQVVQYAEQLVADTELSVSLRARTLLDLIGVYIDASDEAKALATFDRLVALPVTPAQTDAFLRVYLRVAQSRLLQKGWHVPARRNQG